MRPFLLSLPYDLLIKEAHGRLILLVVCLPRHEGGQALNFVSLQFCLSQHVKDRSR